MTIRASHSSRLSILPKSCARLFDNFERRALAVARGRTGEKCTNCLNGLAIAPDNATDVALPQLDPEDRHSPVWNFGEHHLVRIIDQFPNDELEKFFHADSGGVVDVSTGGDGGSDATGAGTAVGSVATAAGALAFAAFFAAAAAVFFAAASGFLFFLIRLRTVSEGCAPRATQYSILSSLSVLL